MLYTAVLSVHLLTAALTGLIFIYALYVLAFKKINSYYLCTLLVGFIASLEVVTGVGLVEISPTLTAASLSLHMLEYLGVCLFVEILLFTRIKRFAPPALSS